MSKLMQVNQKKVASPKYWRKSPIHVQAAWLISLKSLKALIMRIKKVTKRQLRKNIFILAKWDLLNSAMRQWKNKTMKIETSLKINKTFLTSNLPVLFVLSIFGQSSTSETYSPCFFTLFIQYSECSLAMLSTNN